MMPWTSESDCTLTSYPPHLISSPILPPPLPPPAICYTVAALSVKNPRFFLVFSESLLLESFSAHTTFNGGQQRHLPLPYLQLSAQGLLLVGRSAYLIFNHHSPVQYAFTISNLQCVFNRKHYCVYVIVVNTIYTL